MPRRLRFIVAAATLAVAAFAPALAPAVDPDLAPGGRPHGAGFAAAATAGSLNVSPSKYVPGQALRFQGNIGITGSRLVHLQSHMNRPGDSWLDVPNSTFRTDARGNFDFRFRAPAMINISYRVAGGGRVTNDHRFNANPQELTLTPLKGSPDYPFYPVRAGAVFTVVADTTPAIKTSFGTPPAIPGRTVRLQEREGTTRWRTIATATTDVDGNAYFKVTAPRSGSRVLRALQEPWTVGANDIGWYASFPAFFVTGAVPQEGPRTTGATPTYTSQSPHRPTASQRYRWGQSRWDYAWEAGHSLDSPPSRGDVKQGEWLASSDGTGRATPFNGGLVLQSKFKKVGPGDRGTTSAILQGGAQEHGRWEFRLQGRPWETGARNYRFRVDLVPAGTRDSCTPDSIVVAAFTMTKPGMRFGVRSGSTGSAWRGKLPSVLLAEQPFSVAVEIGRGHITWFREGRPIGTVKAPHAQPGVNLVPRLSLIGSDEEMNGAQVNSDWQRSWTLRAGEQVESGPRLRHTKFGGC